MNEIPKANNRMTYMFTSDDEKIVRIYFLHETYDDNESLKDFYIMQSISGKGKNGYVHLESIMHTLNDNEKKMFLNLIEKYGKPYNWPEHIKLMFTLKYNSGIPDLYYRIKWD